MKEEGEAQGKKIRLLFQDEARIGQKGRVCHRRFTRGKRPSGRCDQRYAFAYTYGAVELGTDNAFALILPEVSANAMQVYLDKLAETIGPDEHVLLVLDQAGWHEAKTLRIPASITLEPLPPCSPELNPVERVWLFLKEKFLSHRLLDDYDAILDAGSGCVEPHSQGARTPCFPLLLPLDYQLLSS
ncbi:MAG: IS630 family transposase [Rhodomicrobium sp.]